MQVLVVSESVQVECENCPAYGPVYTVNGVPVAGCCVLCGTTVSLQAPVIGEPSGDS